MAIFRAGFFPDFHYGDAVVLVCADRDGLHAFQSAVRSAHEDGDSAFEANGIQYRIQRRSGASEIQGLTSQTVEWNFDDAKLVEILDLIKPLVDTKKPGHQYLDYVNGPASTVIFSVDEYIDGGPFAEYPQGLPVPRPTS